MTVRDDDKYKPKPVKANPDCVVRRRLPVVGRVRNEQRNEWMVFPQIRSDRRNPARANIAGVGRNGNVVGVVGRRDDSDNRLRPHNIVASAKR